MAIYDPKTDRFEQYRPRPDDPGALPSGGILALAEGADGDVWVGTYNVGVARWDAGNGRFHLAELALSEVVSNLDLTARSLLFDRDGDLWVGTRNGVQRLRHGATKFERVASQAGVAGSLDGVYVYGMAQASDGRLWIGTQSSGFAVLDPATERLTRFQSESGHPWVNGFVESSPGRIWVSTFGAGIDVVDSTRDTVVERIRSDRSLPGTLKLDRLSGLLVDRSGLVWVGTWGAGLQRYNPLGAAAIRTVRQSGALKNGLSLGTVLSTLAVDATTIWVGTAGNGIDILDLERGVVAGHRPDATRAGALRDGTVHAMARGTDGSIWVGTQQAGLQRFSLHTGQFAEPVKGLPRDRIERLLLTRAGNLVVGFSSAILLLDPADNTIRTLELAAGQPYADTTQTVVEDTAGRLWVVGRNSFLMLAPGAEYAQSVDSPEFSESDIASGGVDAGGNLWLFGPNTVVRLRDWVEGRPRFEDYRSRLGMLPRDRGLAAVGATPQGAGLFGGDLPEDRRGRLWTPWQVMDPALLCMHELGKADGLDIGASRQRTFAKTADGRFLFAGIEGLAIVDPERFEFWEFVPPVIATELKIDGLTRPLAELSGGLKLDPEQENFSIEFAALDYSAPMKNRFAYRLLGAEADWIETDAAHRNASYGGLWPGDYTLEVRGSGRSGEWSRHQLRIPITVLPAFWQTGWFALLVSLGVIVAAWGGLRWRTARLSAEARRLQSLVDARTADIRATLEKLTQAQQQLVQQEKMAALGTLTAGVAHEINNPTNFADGAVQNLQSEHQQLHDFLRHLAGDDAPPEILAAIAERFTHLDEMTATAREGHERIKRIVRDLRQFTRLDEADRKAVPIAEPIQSTVNLVRTRFDRIRFELDLKINPNIDCQPAKLGQVFMNLIMNACEAIGERKDGRAGVVRIATTIVGAEVAIEIADNGAGMDETTLQRVFEPFFTTKAVGAGTGLGLAIVFGIVKDHGGSIDVNSTPDVGTRFCVRLPLVNAPALGLAGAPA